MVMDVCDDGPDKRMSSVASEAEQHVESIMQERWSEAWRNNAKFRDTHYNDNIFQKAKRWYDKMRGNNDEVDIIPRSKQRQMLKEIQDKNDNETQAKLMHMIDRKLTQAKERHGTKLTAAIQRKVFNELLMRMQGKKGLVRQSQVNYMKTQLGIHIEEDLTTAQRKTLISLFSEMQANKADEIDKSSIRDVNDLIERVKNGDQTTIHETDFSDVLTEPGSEAREVNQAALNERFLMWSDYKSDERTQITDRVPYDMQLAPTPVLKNIYQEIDSWMARDDGRLENGEEGWFNKMKRKFKQSFMFKHSYVREDHTGTLADIFFSASRYMDTVEHQHQKYSEFHHEAVQELKNSVLNQQDLGESHHSKEKFSAFYGALSRMLKGEYTPYIEIRDSEDNVVDTLRPEDQGNIQQFLEKYKEVDKEGKRAVLKMEQNKFNKETKHFDSTGEDAFYKYRDLKSENIQEQEEGYARVTEEKIKFTDAAINGFLKAASIEQQGLDEFFDTFQEKVVSQNERAAKIKDNLNEKSAQMEQENDPYSQIADMISENEKITKSIQQKQGREQYFPTEYNQYFLGVMALDLRRKLSTAEEILKNGYNEEQHGEQNIDWQSWLQEIEQDGVKEKVLKEITARKNKISDQIQARDYTDYENKQDELEEAIGIKEQQGEMDISPRVSKHLKEITGKYDISEGRSDATMVNDYIRDVIQTYERNRVMLKAAQNLSDLPNDYMRKYVVDGMLKTITRRQDLPTNIMGVEITNEKVSNFLSSNTPIKMSPQHFEKITGIVNNWMTSSLLWRYSTAVGNMAGALQRNTTYGFESWNRARHEFNANKEVWRKEVEKAGVLGFRNHFIEYTGKRLRAEGKAEYADDMKTILKTVKKRAEEGKINLSETTENEMKSIMKEIAYEEFDRKYAKQITQWALESKIFGIVPGMAQTEEHVRTASFIHGVQLAEEMLGTNYISQINNARSGENYQGLPKSIRRIARNLVYEQDFMLAEIDFPLAMQGNVGNFLTKLKPWQLNKMSYDTKTIKRAWNSTSQAMFEQTDENMLSKGMNKMAHLGRFFKELGKAAKKENKNYNPAMGHMLNFLTVFGLSSAFFNILYYSPLMPRFVRRMADIVPHATVASRVHSPILSLGMDIPIMAATMMLGHSPFDPEDELDETEFFRLLRYSPMGVGPMALTHFAFFMGEKLAGHKEDQKTYMEEHGLRSMSMLPFGREASMIMTGLEDTFVQ